MDELKKRGIFVIQPQCTSHCSATFHVDTINVYPPEDSKEKSEKSETKTDEKNEEKDEEKDEEKTEYTHLKANEWYKLKREWISRA